jgi:hypothetical protein
MATRNRRNEWHQVNEKWARSVGERGMRVRLFQKRRDVRFYRTVWIPGRGRDHASMMTKDRGEGERLGRLLLSELLRQEEVTLPGRLTLGALWDRYKRECAAFLDNKPDSRRGDEGRAKVLLASSASAARCGRSPHGIRRPTARVAGHAASSCLTARRLGLCGRARSRWTSCSSTRCCRGPQRSGCPTAHAYST